MRKLVQTVFLSMALLALIPAAASATFIPGPNGKIAFASGRANSEVPSPADKDDAKARIWVADYPSGTPAQVTTEPAGLQHRHPNWSPDHTKIVYAAGAAFSGEYALWIVDLETGDQTEFVAKAKGQDRPTWSPDGTRIAYGSLGDLWVKGVASGSSAVQLTNTPAVTEERPVWSPDGETLYYNRADIPVDPKKKRDIYLKSPVTPGGSEIPIVTGETEDWQPSLSPDGKRLCFLRGGQDETADLWTVSVSGVGAASFAASAKGDLNCVWSPDGTRILYTVGAFYAGELTSRNINGGDLITHSALNVAEHFDGNADWATNFSPKCEQRSANLEANQFATLQLSCTDPDEGFGATPPHAAPLDPQALEIVSPPAHGNLGGLSQDTGRIVYTPNKDFTGTDSFAYVGFDGTSNSPPATVTIRVSPKKTGGGGGGKDTTAPKITAVKVLAKSWRLGKRLASISLVPVGTSVSFKLSEAAKATLSFQRKARKRGRTVFKTVGSTKALAAKAGRNKVRFEGLLSGSKALAAGSYRVVVGAKDAAGNSAKPKNGPTFTIVAE